MKYGNRTDLAYETASGQKAVEGIEIEKSEIHNLPLIRIKVDKHGANKIGKSEGEYITLFCGGNGNSDENSEIEAIAEILNDLVPKKGRILVAGLGNEDITPDSLGVRAAAGVMATAHFSSESEFDDFDMREVYVIETGVMAQTGIESAAQIKYLSDGINPDCVIAVDSLACSEFDRLGKTVQITDTGIAPGSGVRNMRKELSRKTLGIPVVAIGVPTVIDLQSLIKPKKSEISGMVMMRDIDATVNRYAKVISKALNKVLIPTLSEDEINKLLI